MSKQVLLVHGGLTGAWEWDLVVPELEKRGQKVTTVELATKRQDGTLEDDEAIVREALAKIGEPTVLVGHSYSGIVITAASAGNEKVSDLVYVCAGLPGEGQSLSDASASEPGDIVIDEPDVGDEDEGLATFRRNVVGDATEEEWQSIRSKIGELASSVFSAKPSGLGWKEHPSTYVVCTLDRTFSPTVQRRMAERATRSVDIEAAHLPMVTRPTELAAVIGDLADK